MHVHSLTHIPVGMVMMEDIVPVVSWMLYIPTKAPNTPCIVKHLLPAMNEILRTRDWVFYSIGGNTSQNTETNSSDVSTTYGCLYQWRHIIFNDEDTIGCLNVWIVIFSVLASFSANQIKRSFPSHPGLYIV